MIRLMARLHVFLFSFYASLKRRKSQNPSVKHFSLYRRPTDNKHFKTGVAYLYRQLTSLKNLICNYKIMNIQRYDDIYRKVSTSQPSQFRTVSQHVL
jgi:hypothetical protein